MPAGAARRGTYDTARALGYGHIRARVRTRIPRYSKFSTRAAMRAAAARARARARALRMACMRARARYM